MSGLIIVLSILAALTLPTKALESQYILPITKDEPTNQFYTTFNIGATAKSPVNFLLDLGTSLTWADCRKIKSLASLRLVNCQSSTCKSILGNTCESGKNCLHQQPNPFSSVTGRVVQDTATLIYTTTDKKSPSSVSLRPITFSCATTKTPQGLPPPVAGVLGLSQGEHAFWRQVYMASPSRIVPQFGFCLPSSGAGRFYIGDVPNLEYVTMTLVNANAFGDYQLALQSINVEGTPLTLKPSLLKDGARLNTLAPYTVLHSESYNALANSFTLKAKAMGISQVPSVAPFKHCFDARAVAGKKIPRIELGIAGMGEEAKWTFHETNTVVNVNKSVMCLAFIDGGNQVKENVVVGTHQLQNYLIVFNNLGVLTFSDSLLLHNTSCSTL